MLVNERVNGGLFVLDNLVLLLGFVQHLSVLTGPLVRLHQSILQSAILNFELVQLLLCFRPGFVRLPQLQFVDLIVVNGSRRCYKRLLLLLVV